jgi:hypothetical protein
MIINQPDGENVALIAAEELESLLVLSPDHYSQ